jgi:deoxyguanosine kinase
LAKKYDWSIPPPIKTGFYSDWSIFKRRLLIGASEFKKSPYWLIDSHKLFNKMVFIVVVDGLIASGKSSILRELGTTYGYEVEQQRVSEWTLLAPFYSDPKKYAVPLQFQILDSYKKIWEKVTTDTNPNKIIFLEAFSLSSFEVFARMLHDDKVIDDEDLEKIESHAQNNHTDQLYPDLFLYLDCQPEKCMERIATRGRPGEENIKRNYMDRLDTYYSNFITRCESRFPIMRVDNNTTNQAKSVALMINELCLKRSK